MKKDRNIDELFREKLLNFEQEPPAYLLENILAKTAADRRKKKIILWRIAGVAAGLLLAFIAGWQMNYLDSQKAGQSIGIAKTEIQDVKTGKNSQEPEIEGIQGGNKLQVLSDNLGTIQSEKIKTANTNAAKQPVISFDETAENFRTEERTVLKTIQRLEQRFKTNRYRALALAEMKTSGTEKELEALTIDQQIMKQNQEILRTKKSVNDKARWIVGALVSPEYSVSRSSHSQVYASNMLNTSSTNPVDLGGGISVEVKTGKRWSLQSGVYYSALEQSSTNSPAVSQKDYMFADASNGKNFFNTNVSIDAGNNKLLMNSTAGVIELNSIPAGIEIGTNIEDKALAPAVIVSDARFIQNFEYIEIPVYLRYLLVDSRFDIEVLGGVSSNVLVGNQTFMETGSTNNMVGRTKDMQSVNYSGTVGLGLKYNLTKNLFLNVEPRIKYYLNSLNNSESVTYKPYTIGVFSGLSYQF
jgi:hypothetical protein